MQTRAFLGAFGVLLIAMGVIDWRVGGIQEWCKSRLLAKSTRLLPVADQYESLRYSLGSRILSIMILCLGAIAIGMAVAGRW